MNKIIIDYFIRLNDKTNSINMDDLHLNAFEYSKTKLIPASTTSLRYWKRLGLAVTANRFTSNIIDLCNIYYTYM